MPDGQIDVFGFDAEECRGKRGEARTLCNALVFAERHPMTAKAMINIGCPAIKMAIEHPSMMRAVRMAI